MLYLFVDGYNILIVKDEFVFYNLLALRWTDAPVTSPGSKQLSFNDAGKAELANYPRDFVRLNREAVDRGLFTSRQQSDFRANNDLRLIPRPRSRRNTASVPPPDMVFGYPAR